MNPVPVFKRTDWDNPAPGVYEAVATAPAFGEPPPFQAVAWISRDDYDRPIWGYELYRPDPYGPTRDYHLAAVTSGTARTLTEAQHLLEIAARHQRDHAIGCYSPYAIVVCDNCGTHQQLEAVLMAGHCLGDEDRCTSTTFDGHDLDQLAAAVA